MDGWGNTNIYIKFLFFLLTIGPKLIEKVRPDLIRKFAALSGDGDATVAEYIFHCNAQTPS